MDKYDQFSMKSKQTLL